MTVLTFDSKDSVINGGYLTYDDAAKKLKLRTRQLYRYRKDGIISVVYGRLWKGKPFPIMAERDVNALVVIRRTPRKELMNLAETTKDKYLRTKIIEWLNPFARSAARTALKNKQK